MARCPICGAGVPEDARFCPHCGTTLRRRRITSDQLPLPGSIWGPPPAVLQPAGAGATVSAEQAVGRPLSGWTVAISVTAILLVLAAVFLLTRRNSGTEAPMPAAGPAGLPTLGMVGESVAVGETVIGVAFTSPLDRFGSRAPTRGQFYVVGVVIGNQSEATFTLSAASLALLENEHRYSPMLAAWGTPDELNEGRYTTTFALRPREVIAGLLIFDVPAELPAPFLLVRDYAAGSAEYSGVIDLTHQVRQEEAFGRGIYD